MKTANQVEQGQAAEAPPAAATRAVLLMAYGSPQSADEILPYYTHMRGGRPPGAEALAELERRYQVIGGGSPLQGITNAQAKALESELSRRHSQISSVVVGMKHSAPFIEDAVAQLAAGGASELVGIVLAPHYSSMSIGGYVERAERAAHDQPGRVRLSFVKDWHLDPGYIDWLARELDRQLPAGERHATLVIFTAHSLPSRLKEMGDPYPGQLLETAQAAAEAAGLTLWTTAWQSVARTGEPWLGPELLEVIRDHAREGRKQFLVCACGFTADHLEILFDLDVEAQEEAARLGVVVRRTAMPNSDPAFIGLLADIAERGWTAPD